MVIPSYKPLIGGAEQQLDKLSRFISNQNISVKILTRKIKGSIPEKKVIHVPCFNSNILFSILSFFYLIILSNKKSIIHCHTLSSPAYFSGLFSILFNKKLILKVTNYGPDSQIELIKKNLFKKFLFKLFKNKIFFVALNNEIKKEIINFNVNSSRIFVIPNGVNIKNFKKKYNDDKNHILYLGRLIKRKRVIWILDFMLFLKQTNESLYRNTILHIVGDGIEAETLRKFVLINDILDNTIFYGNISSKKIKYELLRKSHFFVLCSYSEGMSNSLLEALSFKNLCVVSNISANTELIENNVNGLTFSSKKIFFKQMLFALENPFLVKDIATNGYNYVLKNNDINIVGNKYINLYRFLVNIE